MNQNHLMLLKKKFKKARAQGECRDVPLTKLRCQIIVRASIASIAQFEKIARGQGARSGYLYCIIK